MSFRPVRNLLLFSLVAGGAGCAAGTGEEREDGCAGGKCDDASGAEALCSVRVNGVGRVDMEEDYLPRVLACENRAAPPASLRAQAIAARSYAYYVARVERRALEPGIRDQDYGCGARPEAQHFAAARETAGMVMRFRGTQVAGFFVAGALQSPPGCDDGTQDPSNTELFVTYNEGAAGSAVEPTALAGENDHNRGCMSQNGANCLSETGLSTEEILRYYYGADIEVVQTRGACVGEGTGVTEEGHPWISTPCVEESTCSFEVAGASGECLEWFDKDEQELRGMCSIDCAGFCPDALDFPRTMCVEIDGSGHCAVESTVENGFCDHLPGAENKVMARFTGGVAPSEVRTMCAPPDAPAVECEAAGQPGTCIDVERTGCGGELHAGQCPGDASIKCCTP